MNALCCIITGGCWTGSQGLPSFDRELNKDDIPSGVKRSKSRLPTDWLCFILFIVFLIIMLVIGIFGFNSGEPSRLYLPTDYMGRFCGRDNSNIDYKEISLPRSPGCMEHGIGSEECRNEIDNQGLREDLTDRPVLWFMATSLGQPFTYGGVCIEYCPGSGPEGSPYCPPSLSENTAVNGEPYCSYTRKDNAAEFPLPGSDVVESLFSYSTILDRCIPVSKPSFDDKKSVLSTLQSQSDQSTSDESTFNDSDSGSDVGSGMLRQAVESGARLWGDTLRAWPVILLCSLMAVLVSFIVLFLLRLFAGVVVWTLVFGCLLLLSILSVVLIASGRSFTNQLQERDLDDSPGRAVYYIGIICAVITFIYSIVLMFLFGKIRRAIGIIKESTKAVIQMPQVFGLPVLVVCLLIGFYTYWIAVTVFLWSAGQATVEEDGYVVEYDWDNTLRGIFGVHLFGFLWITQFVLAFEYMTVAGAVAHWYWTREKSGVWRQMPVVRSMVRTIVYHAGTIAVGSLLVAVIQFMRIMLRYASRRLNFALKRDRVLRWLRWFVHGVLWILEALIKYINRHAYVQTAIYGTSFFISARNSFFLILRHPLQMATVSWIVIAFTFICRISVAAFCCSIAFALVQVNGLISTDEPLLAPILVAAIVFVFSYAIAYVFLGVYDTAVDTVLHSFLMDIELARSGNKPFCSSSLSKFIEYNEKEEKKFVRCGGCCSCLDYGEPNPEIPDGETEKEMESKGMIMNQEEHSSSTSNDNGVNDNGGMYPTL